MIQLKVLKGPNKLGEEIDVQGGKSLMMGRSQDCDVQLVSYGVSKQHCKVTALAGGRLEVEDLGSSNGTFVNGVQVQKHIVRPGDSISLSGFVLQIQWKADALPSPTLNAHSSPNVIHAQFEASHAKPLRSAPKTSAASQFSLWIDPLREVMSVHKLLFFGFLIWTFTTILLSVIPFSKQSNLKIQENSIEIAKLYARQLARINQKAIVEQRNSDIIDTIDEKIGDTKGVKTTYILDAQRSRIIAPITQAGNTLPNAAAVEAVRQRTEWWYYDPTEKIAYVSAPILVGTNEGNNIIAATAFIVFDPSHDLFSFAKILEAALTSLIILLVLSGIAIFVYQRFIISPVEQLSINLERAVITGEPFEKSKVIWKELNDINEKVDVIIGRLPQNDNGGDRLSGEWALLISQNNPTASASFDESLKITEWNNEMQNITGVRRDYAVNSDLGVASRDMSFEASVRELAQFAQSSPWTPQTKGLDFQGNSCSLIMIYGASNYLLMIRKEIV